MNTYIVTQFAEFSFSGILQAELKSCKRKSTLCLADVITICVHVLQTWAKNL